MAKQIIKRLIPLLAGVGITAAAASNVVSCVAPQYATGVDGQRVVVATDGGHINDHSFNEDAYDGVNNFMHDAYNLGGKSDYVEAAGVDVTSIVTGYRLAIYKKANAIVLPGFSHVNTIPEALPLFRKHNINIVLVDGQVKDPRVISIQFNSQLSGVMAGFDTSFLAGTNVKKYDTNGDGKIKIGTFAGSSNKYGVDNYMWGLLLGMQMYNDMIKTDWFQQKGIKADPVYTANDASGKIEDIQSSGTNDPYFYTGSFTLGDATKSGIVGKLVGDNKADIMFPVAGPQIQDVLSYQPQSGRTPYIIGVDVDQEAAYAKNAFRSDGTSRFITAAIKNIGTAVPEALYRASNESGQGNTLKNSSEFGVKPSGTYGSWDSGHWLGTTPSPRVNWSIDYTDNNVPNDQGKGRYLLKNNFIKLYDPSNVLIDSSTAKAVVMEAINSHFAKLGDSSSDYMNGKDIYQFADSIVKNYLTADDVQYDEKTGNWVADFYKNNQAKPIIDEVGDSHE